MTIENQNTFNNDTVDSLLRDFLNLTSQLNSFTFVQPATSFESAVVQKFIQNQQHLAQISFHLEYITIVFRHLVDNNDPVLIEKLKSSLEQLKKSLREQKIKTTKPSLIIR